MKKTLITGISGQDSAYLSKLLLEDGHHIVGGLRRGAERSLWRLRQLGIENDIEVIDFGVPLLSIHTPYAVSSKVDVYSLYRAAKAFFQFSE